MVKAYGCGPPPAQVLMARLVRCGVLFLLHDGRLAIDAPRGVLSDSDRHALVARKAELLALVFKAEGWGQDPPVAEADPMDDWPASSMAEFEVMRAENVRIGHVPGEAARLAYEGLKWRHDGIWTDPKHADIDWDVDVRALVVPEALPQAPSPKRR